MNYLFMYKIEVKLLLRVTKLICIKRLKTLQFLREISENKHNGMAL